MAQAVTARIMVAAHLHIIGIIFRKLDVKNAYINEKMKRLIHVKMPPGYLVYIKRRETPY